MPIYGYRCTACGHELEVLQSMSAEPLKVCSECGGALRKLLYPVGVQFKGSGFYTTDYKNGNGSGKSKTESSGASESKGSESKGSESSSASSSSDSNGSSTSSDKKTESAGSKE